MWRSSDRRVKIITGDCLQSLRSIGGGAFQTCVTSPPYFGLRDYGVAGQIGLEETPSQYVDKLVAVFREVRRVLRDDGTVWLNLGDSWGKGKNILGIPWRVAFALQVDGWCLRQDIIWSKINPMPESVTDRCTKAHEYIFLMAKGEDYFYNSESIKEKAKTAGQKMTFTTPYKVSRQRGSGGSGNEVNGKVIEQRKNRNKRSVWTVGYEQFDNAHFATFPTALIKPCVLAGCPEGGRVLDPFGGAGTTAVVAVRYNRKCTLLELNPKYVELAKPRIEAEVSKRGFFK